LGSGSLFLLHAANHSLVKNALFLLAGNILALYGTKSLGKLAGLQRAAPGIGLLLALAGLAVAGRPPFGTFFREWLLLRAMLGAGQAWAAGLVIAGLTLTFVAVACHLGRILFGAAPALPAKPLPSSWLLVPSVLVGLSVLAGLLISPRVLTALVT